MNSTPHRNNSDFQLRHFIAGGCHTADGAWNILYEQMLDIKIKIEATRAQMLRREARKIEIEQGLKSATGADLLRAKADEIEWKSADGLLDLALAGAKKELATIISLMAELEPYRKYAHLPLLEGTEAAQADEWRLELTSRAEEFLATTGTIPQDHLRAMRNHPDFQSHILPRIREVSAMIGDSNSAPLAALTPRNNLLLDHSSD